MVVPDEDAAHDHLARAHLLHHRQDEDDAAVAQVAVEAVVEDGPHGGLGAAHDALHPVGRAQEVRAVDGLPAADADQDVLDLVGHADHFVRHHLAEREDGRVAALDKPAVDLDGNLVVRHARAQHAAGDLVDVVGGHDAELHEIIAPAVLAEALQRDHVPEHAPQLVPLHGEVGAEGRHHIAARPRADLLVEHAGQCAGVAVDAGAVGGQGQRAGDVARVRDRRADGLALDVLGDGAVGAACGEDHGHGLPACFHSPGAEMASPEGRFRMILWLEVTRPPRTTRALGSPVSV